MLGLVRAETKAVVAHEDAKVVSVPDFACLRVMAAEAGKVYKKKIKIDMMIADTALLNFENLFFIMVAPDTTH